MSIAQTIDLSSTDDEFSYLIDKIAQAPFRHEPFPHIEIFDLLSEEHFCAVTGSPQVTIPTATSTEQLLGSLEEHGYEVIAFPGCVTSKKAYLQWLEGRRSKPRNACEGFGMAFRLTGARDPVLSRLDNFFRSEDLKDVLVRKFGIERPTAIESGFQKYLHGYEISPHPDIRRKALTWMLNVNPSADSEDLEIHTHYMRFAPERSYIAEFWQQNPSVDRCWVPWNWCDTVKQQPTNNSLVMFAPSDRSLHAVRARYDHLRTQRTQYYGNLWYSDAEPTSVVSFDALDIAGKAIGRAPLGARILKRLNDRMRGTGYVG